MAFDGLVMAAVKTELEAFMIGGRVEKIFQPLPSEIHMLVHHNKNKFRLLLSADARNARVHISTQTKENPFSPPLFCMVLRKHLEGGRILSLEQKGLERVLKIVVEGMDELGRLSKKHLYCEVMGKHSNVILVDPSTNQILDGIQRYSYATSRHREVLPGRQYIAPPETGKQDPLTAAEESFIQAVWAKEDDTPLDKLILSHFEGFSPQTCREIVKHAGLDLSTASQTIGEIDLRKLWNAFTAIRDAALKGEFKPVLCRDKNGKMRFSAIPLTLEPGASCRQETMNTVLDTYYNEADRMEKLKKSGGDLLRVVRSEIKKVEKKVMIYRDTLNKAEHAETYKIYGELITANLYQIPEKTESVELLNYYDPEGKTVFIEMDRQKSPSENAQAYFKQYNKARHSKEVTLEYLEKSEKELNYLETVQTAIEQAESLQDLTEIKAELIKEGYIKPEAPVKGKKEPVITEPKPLSVKTAEGYEILVGRNNRQNDYLTMKLAQPEDLWFHVKDIPGSHVIIRKQEGREVPDEVLQIAAEIAAYHSKARESSKVSVDFTQRKHVRKPKAAKPGMVIYDSQRTVYVEPKMPE